MGGKEMKLGVICDGISRNLRHAVDVMDEFGLQYASCNLSGTRKLEITPRPKLLRLTLCFGHGESQCLVCRATFLRVHPLPTVLVMLCIASTWML